MKAKGHALEVEALLSAMNAGQALRLFAEEGMTKTARVIADYSSTGRAQERYEILG